MKGRWKPEYTFEAEIEDDEVGEFELDVDAGYLRWWRADTEECFWLSADDVRDLLPLLQHFAETGKLPEPKS